MADRMIQDRLREEYFDLLPDIRRVAEQLEAQIRYYTLPILRSLNRPPNVWNVTSRIKDGNSRRSLSAWSCAKASLPRNRRSPGPILAERQRTRKQTSRPMGFVRTGSVTRRPPGLFLVPRVRWAPRPMPPYRSLRLLAMFSCGPSLPRGRSLRLRLCRRLAVAFATGIFAFDRLRLRTCGLASGAFTAVAAAPARNSAKLSSTNFSRRSKVGRGVHVAGEAKKRSAVIGQDGAINAHQSADRHPRIPRQHLVTHEVERHLRAGDVGADDIAQAKRKLAGNRSNVFPERVRQMWTTGRPASRQIRPHEYA